MSTSAKKKYPTVTTTIGIVFELRPETMVQREASYAGAVEGWCRWRATRKAVLDALLSDHIRISTVEPEYRVRRYCGWHNEKSNARQLGCMSFSKYAAAKIRKWAKGATR